MEVKWTITLGEVLQIVSLLIVVFGFYNKISNAVVSMQTDLNMIKKWWEHYIIEGNKYSSCPQYKTGKSCSGE